MSIIEDAKTGFDLELMIHYRFIEQVAQLLLDAGVLPKSIVFPSPFEAGEVIELFIASRLTEFVPRTYGPTPGFAYTDEDSEAFMSIFRVYPTEDTLADFIYLQLRLVTHLDLNFDLYIKVQKDLNVQELAQILADDDPADPDRQSLPLNDILSIAAILGEGLDFDPIDPTKNMLPDLVPVLVDINTTIATIGAEIATEEAYSAVHDFLLSQLDSLATLRLDELHLRVLDEGNKLALCVNLILLDSTRGFAAARGDLNELTDFLSDEQDIALATGPQLLENLIADVLHKTVLSTLVEEEDLTDEEITTSLLGERFPLRIPDSMVAELIGSESDNEEEDSSVIIGGYLNGLRLGTSQKEFTFENGETRPFESLNLVFEIDAVLADLFNLASGNLELDLFPLTTTKEEITVSDLTIQTNVAADLWRGFLSITGFVVTAIGAIVDLFTDADEATIKLSDLFDIPLVDLALANKRWDPFYLTQHTLLFGVDQQRFQQDRFGFQAKVHLSKRFTPFYNIYLREVETQGNVLEQLLFKVEQASSIITVDHFASDRDVFTQRTEDHEQAIYALPAGEAVGSPLSRIAIDKFYPFKPYEPFCRTMDDDHQYIQYLRLLSTEEVNDLERQLIRNFVNGIVDEMIAGIQASISGELDEETISEIRKVLYPLIEDNAETDDYIDHELQEDLEIAIYAPGKLRLSLKPFQLQQLIGEGVLLFWGFEPIIREGTLYFRGIADETEANNLLYLPQCSDVNNVD